MAVARTHALFAPAFGILVAGVGLGAARADPARDAGSAMSACLAAVIDNAPVADAKIQGVSVHREAEPNLCTVHVASGDPAAIRKAVIAAVTARRERFAPMRSPWDPAPFASREAFCSAPFIRRSFNVLVETARPGGPEALSASVLETPARDERCDLDYGTQHP